MTAPSERRRNVPALVGLALSGGSLVALFISIGLLAPVTLLLSGAGAITGRVGVHAVDRGTCLGRRDLGRAAFWLGLVGMVASLVAIAAWVSLIVLFADDIATVDSGRLLLGLVIGDWGPLIEWVLEQLGVSAK